jgi:predicted HTH transcriptional regulator
MIEMSDTDLLSRLVNFEDHFVERKTVADQKDWLKAVVAFANSAPVGMPCILYIGVKDDGQFETKTANFDSVQKTLNQMLQKTYPRVPYLPKIITDGKSTALAVIVYGSEQRPHFSGPSYIRRGSETFEASAEQFDSLIAIRSAKVYFLRQHIGELVTVVNISELGNGTTMRGNWTIVPKIVDCNQCWLTLQGPNQEQQCFIPRDVDITYSPAHKRLMLEITTRQM